MNSPVMDYSSVVRLGLQPGATMQRGGKTYVLNEHHRWTLPKQQGGPPTKPSQAAPQPQAKSPKQAQPQQPSGKPKQSPSGQQPRANSPSQQQPGVAACRSSTKPQGKKSVEPPEHRNLNLDSNRQNLRKPPSSRPPIPSSRHNKQRNLSSRHNSQPARTTTKHNGAAG